MKSVSEQESPSEKESPSDRVHRHLKDFQKSKETGHLNQAMRVIETIEDHAKPETSEAATIRKSKTTLLLEVLRIAIEERERLGPKVEPKRNVAPPGHKYRSGIDPRSIDDPEDRAIYEAALAENRRIAALAIRQGELDRLIAHLSKLFDTYLVGAFARRPGGPQELQQILEEAGVDKESKQRIMKMILKTVE